MRSVNEAFGIFASRLTPTASERAAAASHRQSVGSCLDSNIGLQRFFQSGSYGAGTSIRWYSDVDYFASIKPNAQRSNSTTMLTVTRDALKSRFPLTPVNVRGPVVRIDFGTDGSERYEVVPSYYVKTVDGESVYKIPNGAGVWIVSSPETHNAYVSAQNDRLGKGVKPLVRFMKAWAYYNAVPISSFYLELRTAKYAEGESTIVYDIDVERVFRLLVDADLAPIRDPKGIVAQVPACSSGSRADAISKLKTASVRATKARAAREADRDAEAFDWWDKVFAGHFPSSWA